MTASFAHQWSIWGLNQRSSSLPAESPQPCHPLRGFPIPPLNISLELQSSPSVCVTDIAHCESGELSHAFSRPWYVFASLGCKRNLWIFLPILVEIRKSLTTLCWPFWVSFLLLTTLITIHCLGFIEIWFIPAHHLPSSLSLRKHATSNSPLA